MHLLPLVKLYNNGLTLTTDCPHAEEANKWTSASIDLPPIIGNHGGKSISVYKDFQAAGRNIKLDGYIVCTELHNSRQDKWVPATID